MQQDSCSSHWAWPIEITSTLFIKLMLAVTGMVLISGCHSLGAGAADPVKIGEHIEGIPPALVEVPFAVEIIKIDSEGSGSFLAGSAMTVAIPPGERMLSVRYRNLWPEDDGSHLTLKSDIVSFRANFESGVSYSIAAPPYFKTAAAAQQYVDAYRPSVLQAGSPLLISFVDAAAEKQVATVARVPQPVSDAVTRLPAHAVAENSSVTPITTSIKKPTTTSTTTPTTTPITPTPSAKPQIAAATPIVESMKVLWRQLGADEREAFQAWFVREVQLNVMSTAADQSQLIQ